MAAKLKMPKFEYGISIQVSPDNFNIEDLKISEGNVKEYIVKYKEFFSLEFEDGRNAIDELHERSGIVQVFDIKDNEEKEMDITFDSSRSGINYALIKIGENSSCKITFSRNNGRDYCGEDIRIIMGRNSKLEVISIGDMGNCLMNFIKRRIVQNEGSTVDWNEVILDGEYNRFELVSYLNGEGSKCKQKVFFIGRGKEKFDVFTSAIHKGKNTESELITKSVLSEYSNGLSRGLINIGENASGSIAYEKQDALVVGKNAGANAVPALEIHNADVKCKHGSSIGKIDEEKLFYLMSRGLDLGNAKRKIISGYFDAVIRRIDNKEINERITKEIEEAIR